MHEEGLESAPSVEKETVEKALTEKLLLAKKLKEDLERKKLVKIVRHCRNRVIL